MVSPYIFLKKVMTFFLVLKSDDVIVTSPTLSALIVCQVFFINSATKFYTFIRVSPRLDSVTWGGPPPTPHCLSS